MELSKVKRTAYVRQCHSDNCGAVLRFGNSKFTLHAPCQPYFTLHWCGDTA